MRIDSHQHFWSLDRGDYDWLTKDLAPIYRDFTPVDLHPVLRANKIDGTILVQAAATEAETEYMLSLAEKHDWILGVVGWVDMESPNAAQSIARFAQNPRFVGVRPMIQDIADPNWMLKPELAPALGALVDHGLRLDALLKPQHLTPLHRFISLYPDLRIVIDHCAKPQIREDAFQPWADQIAQIAATSTTMCKLSGLVTEAKADWADQDIRPYAQHVLDCFGPERVMFGSDWPVLKLAGEYDAWVEFVQCLCAELSQFQIDSVFGGTARRFYLAN